MADYNPANDIAMSIELTYADAFLLQSALYEYIMSRGPTVQEYIAR